MIKEDYCCEEFKEVYIIDIIDRDINAKYQLHNDLYDHCGGWEGTDYYTIKYCPFCGKKL